MSQSLSRILVHLIFSTKGRTPFLKSETIRKNLDAYMAGILRNCDSPAVIVKSVQDHAHILCVLSRNLALCKLLEEVKKSSSKWLKTKGEAYERFQWQAGYGAFSVSPSNEDAVRDYIRDQEKHHHRATFQEEFRRFLERHHVEFDERYVWD